MNDEAITLDFSQGAGLDAILPGGEWVIDQGYLDLQHIYKAALDQLAKSERGRERVLPLLSGQFQPELDFGLFAEVAEDLPRRDPGLETQQVEAIASCLAAEGAHLVQGPPGTGKTYVLAKVVRELVKQNRRVLVTALTHRAIHNALNAICSVAPEIQAIAKIGRPVHDPDLRVTQYRSFGECPFANDGGGYVIGATPFSLFTGPHRHLEFDVACIDESSQMALPLAIMPMLRSEKWLFFGDHKQLPPVFASISPGSAADLSIFQRLHGRGFDTMLDVTYRMNRDLCEWPSSRFYGGRLRPAERNANSRLSCARRSGNYWDYVDPEVPRVFFDTGSDPYWSGKADRTNRNEAAEVAELVACFFESGVPLSEIGVVTPFRRQAAMIRQRLRNKRTLGLANLSACLVDTVDRFQGQERDVIIYCCTVRSKAERDRFEEFLLMPQRIKVAVTRARKKLVVVGRREVCEGAALWEDLRSYCHTP